MINWSLVPGSVTGYDHYFTKDQIPEDILEYSAKQLVEDFWQEVNTNYSSVCKGVSPNY